MIASDDQPADQRKGIGRRRSALAGAATPIVRWTVRARDSTGESRADVLTPRGGGGGALAPVSARKLAASLWRLVASSNGSGSVTWRYGVFDRVFEFCSSSTFPVCGMEEATKWDYYYTNGVDGVNDVRSCSRPAAVLKTERFNCYMKRFKESERSSMRLLVKNLADDIKRERRKCRKLDVVNSKLQTDISGARLSARKFLQNIEEEKKGRGLLEKECHELAKYIEGSRAEIGELRDQRARIQEEIEEERQMLQMAEVWREERVQMKLADAKSILENKLAKINNLIVDYEAIMQPSSSTTHCASSVHRTNPHEVSDTTRKSATLNGSEGTRSGKETVTQADVNSCQTPGACSEGTVNKIQRTKNMFSCDANCRKKALCGSQSLQSSEISSVTFMHSTKKGSSIYNTCDRKYSNSSISSSKYQSSPQRALSKRDYHNHCDLAHQWRSTDQRNPQAKKGHVISPPGQQRRDLTSNLIKPELVNKKMLVRDLLEQRDSSTQSSLE